MSFKQERYSSKSDVDELDTLTEKLAADLRQSIRQLENYPILSDPWFEMAETFGRMATISDMESKLSAGKSDATLWETEEQALRFLLEDGKLNLCLRSMIEFKEAQIKARQLGHGPMIDYVQNCDKFEKGIGAIFRNAWQHVEVLQTTDLPALLNHIAETLRAAVDSTPALTLSLAEAGDLHQRQEVLVFYYLDGIMKHVDAVREERVMPIMRERQLLLLAVRALRLYGNKLLVAHRLKAAEALAAVVETEDYSTYSAQYADPNSSADVEVLVAFKEEVLAELAKEMSQRKVVRPLMDAIDKIKRLAARTTAVRK
mmetsp:Transcript_4239/g.6950  ORF Transcript_4239/g.6950 Transcript_4239/m.6950 type:complete len:315 (+) Transcript_4239:78-1022(+)